MTPERWEQVRQLFETAAELDPAKRTAFLEAECGPDADLRAEVDRLLAADETSGGFFGGATNVRMFLGAQPDQPVFSEHDIVADRFLIVRYIGRGGMGEVYEATDLELREQVALKTLLPRYSADQRHVSRFRREVLVARKVKHPNVCKIHDVGRHRDGSADITFLTMELLDGETLSEYLKREGKLKPEEALSVIGQMAAGLQALHENDVVHRDFKPGNIILVPSDDGSPRPVITDFGLAILGAGKQHEYTAVTEPGHILGTPDYMAPEHMASQNVGPWSDIYSFGLVVCKALTGRHPLRREPDEEELQGASAQVLSLLPGSAEQVIRRCLSTIPSERPTKPLEIVRAMSAPGETAPSDITADSAAEGERKGEGARFLTRGRLLAAVSAVLLALVLMSLRLDQQGTTLGGMVGSMLSSLQDDLCARFPGEALFCVLPPDRDIAFRPLAVSADETSDQVYGRGLSRFIGDSLYRLRANKGEFCFHVRDEKQHEGVPLVLSGEMQVSAGTVRIDTTLVRVADGRVLRRQEFGRRTDDLYGLHEGLIRNFAELIGYELEPEQLTSWLAEGPRDATAFADYLAGLELLKDREYERAAERFRSALGGSQGGLAFSAAARGLGDANRHIFAQTNDARWAREAEQAYRQAAGVPSVDLYRSWGALKQAEGEHEDAVQQFEQALEFDPFDYWSRVYLVHSYEALGNRARADEVLRDGVERQPGCWLMRNFMAKVRMENGQLRDSEQSLLKVIQLAPRNPSGYNNLAFLYLSEGRYDEVIEWAAKAIEINDSPPFYLTLGLGYQFRGCIDDAVLNFRHAVQRTPKDFVSWYRLAETLLVAKGDSEETLKAFQQTGNLAAAALTEQPDQREALCAVSRSFALLGRREEALDRLAYLKRVAPSADATYLCAATVHDALGNRAEVLGSLRGGLERGATLHNVAQLPLSTQVRDGRYQLLLDEFGLEQTGARLEGNVETTAACPESTVAGLPLN